MVENKYNCDDNKAMSVKINALKECEKFNSISNIDFTKQYAQLKKMLGKVGKVIWIGKTFSCDNGKNIFIGNNFVGNYNLTILDVEEVHIGNNVMIGPNTVITTVGHPLSPMERRKYVAIAKPIHIGNDVWIGASVTILPGVTIGNNVVVAAGTVVNKDVPDNCVVAGVPAKIIKDIVNDTE